MLYLKNNKNSEVLFANFNLDIKLDAVVQNCEILVR